MFNVINPVMQHACACIYTLLLLTGTLGDMYLTYKIWITYIAIISSVTE